MAQHHDSELVLENAAAVEDHLSTLLLRFAEVIENPHSFERSNFDVSNFHATSTSTNHPLENILSMLERYNQRERSILEIVYDHLSRPGAGVGVAAEDGDSDTEQEDGDESDAPSNESQDPSNQKWTFNNTFLLMDLCLELMKNSELSPMPQTERDEKKIEILKYSIELWFLGKVGQCKYVEVSKALAKTTNEIFGKYISADFGQEDECRLTILREEDCTDLVGILLTTGDFGTQLKTHLEDSKNFKEFNETPMSGSMINMLSPHSSERYIIPRNGDKTRAYGFYVNGLFLGDTTEGLKDTSEYRAIKEAYKKNGLHSDHFEELLVELPLPKKPRSRCWNITDLCDKIENRLKIIESQVPTCSYLLLTLACHGFHEHIVAEDTTYKEIRTLLSKLQREKLKGIPKVVIIQACQNKIVGKTEYDLPKYVREETADTILVMTAQPGKEGDFGSGDFGSYLEFFGKYLCPDGETPIVELVKGAAYKRSNEASYESQEVDFKADPPIHKSKRMKHVVPPEIQSPESLQQKDDSDNNS